MNDSNNPSAIRSRKQITGALMSLMEKYPYEEISVKQIVLETDLVRKTFYRNFKSKDDVLRSHIRTILRDYFDIVNNAKGDVLTTVFEFADKNKKLLKLLDKNDMMYYVSETGFLTIICAWVIAIIMIVKVKDIAAKEENRI